MALLLDTNVAIALRDGDPSTLMRVAASPESVVISLVTLVELEGGIASDPPEAARRRVALDDLLTDVGVAPLDRAVVNAYKDIVRATGFSRRRVLDRLIAATAVLHGWPLATMNFKDFRDIPDLRLEVWPAPAQ